MKFVLFIGNDCVGKTSMAKSLQLLLHRGCKRRVNILSFSDSVRDELIEYYGIPRDIIYNKSIDKNSTIIDMSQYKFDLRIPQIWFDHNLIDSEDAFSTLKITLRELFVTHGTRIRRTDDSQYWSKFLSRKVDDISDCCDLVIVDDAREDEDFDFFNDKDTLIYHLDNNSTKGDNITQQALNNWINNNSNRINKKITLPIPLLVYIADKINIEYVIPDILPREWRQRKW